MLRKKRVDKSPPVFEYLILIQLPFEVPGRAAEVLHKCTVEAGMVRIADVLAYVLQGKSLADEGLGGSHPALGEELVEGDAGFVLKQLGHGGNAHIKGIGYHLQRNATLQVGIHIGADLIQQMLLALGSCGAFIGGSVFCHKGSPPCGVWIFVGRNVW